MANSTMCDQVRNPTVASTARDAKDAGDWLDSERALNEVQLGARLLRQMRAKGIFRGSAR